MRRIRKTFKRPRKAWDLARIKDERSTLKKYGLKRKKELRKAEEVIRGFRGRARELTASKDKEKENILITKLSRMGLLTKGLGLDDVLALTANEVLDRRLQTIVFRKGMAGSINQARQKIVHGHVSVGGRRVVFPSYLVSLDEEKTVSAVGEKGGKR